MTYNQAPPPPPQGQPPVPQYQPPVPQYQPPAFIGETRTGPGLLVRAAWFILVGWWLTGIVSIVAWFAMVTILGLPLGIWLINRIPTALTLRPRTSRVYAWTDGSGYTRTSVVKVDQPPWWIRGAWFVFVGWWASALVMALGYLLVLLLITLPLGLMLFNRVPFAASLYRY